MPFRDDGELLSLTSLYAWQDDTLLTCSHASLQIYWSLSLCLTPSPPYCTYFSRSKHTVRTPVVTVGLIKSLLWAKPCNCDVGWHWFKLFVSYSAPYVGLRSVRWRSRPLAVRIADIKESAGHDGEENWEMLTALQCYIMDKGAENWLMNNLDVQDVWHTLPKAFMHIFTRNCLVNASCVRLSSFRQADGQKNFSRM